ncbi:unnamed protein product [Lupinus luteus]|uniref:GDSL esterase/lipase n=1 Tax=Lupinus luteus TaxID=3873 RepID=A0AAV1Y433_LUPLU
MAYRCRRLEEGWRNDHDTSLIMLTISLKDSNRILSLYDQLNLFKEYKAKLAESVGQEKANEIVAKSLYIVSAGNNDIAITYTRLTRRMPFNEYAGLLVDWTATFAKDLYELGARHLWVFSALPLGCMPIGRSLVGGKQCNGIWNEFATEYNTLLQQNITSFKTATPDYDLQYIDIFNSLNNIVQSYAQLGYESPVNCCGGKSFGLGELCSALTGTCKNSSKHVFWDFAHPTQRTYEILVDEMVKKHKKEKEVVSQNKFSDYFIEICILKVGQR